MTQPDPDSSPEYDPYELFKEELDLDEFDLESTSAPTAKAIATHQEAVDVPFVTQDEDRLYTDELIRQNEMASRSLFLSVITAALISVGIGLWYLLSQKPTPTPQPVAPLPVPEQPTLAPPGFGIPVLPIAPTPPSNPSSTQVPSVAPSDSVTVPGNTLTPTNPNLPSPTNPNSGIVPPPPPSPPASPNNSNR
jgi:hypothetical protein